MMLVTSPPAVARGAVTTIQSTEPFLRVLAEAIVNGDLPRVGGPKPPPERLADYTILMPTNRAARALATMFLELSPNKALLLPRIRPISLGEEDLSLMLNAAAGRKTADDLALPDVMPNLERQLILTELVLKWSQAMRRAPGGTERLDPEAAAGAGTPSQAAKLAAELAQLMDLVETEGVDLAALKTLVPEEFADHWGQTLAFLDIVMSMWPEVLADRGMTTFAARRNASLRAEAERLRQSPPAQPIIVAGVTGSIPATRALMAAVAALPNGALVLPAFDTTLDAATLADIRDAHPEHPQHGLAKLIHDLGITQDQIAVLGRGLHARAETKLAFLSQVMQPPSGTARWPTYISQAKPAEVADALASIERIEAPSPADEAEVIALRLREVAEHPGQTAALVSPDRLLARRVATRLEAWGIRVDDSAGRPLRKTTPGAFLDLVLEAWSTKFAPAALVALLKHPLTRLGLDPFAARKAGRALEIGALRGVVMSSGALGLREVLDNARAARVAGRAKSRAALRLWDEDWTHASDLVARVTEAFAPLTATTGQELPLADFARAHAAVAEAVARTEQPDDDMTLWHGDAGEAAWTVFQGLMDRQIARIALAADDYPEFYRGLIASENVRARTPLHPRIAIWGPFEARLQQPDVVILGSLNDGTWPEAAEPGPWLNRPMRKALGLPQPEAAIGYAAHDVASLLAGPNVLLTRALKTDGVPSVASRWLLRIDALLTGLGMPQALDAKAPWMNWALNRDTSPPRKAAPRPQPRPPIELRPRELSVTAIEKWMADPYAIFAEHILELHEMPALGEDPDAALRGQILHEALGKFARDFPKHLPQDIRAALCERAQQAMSEALVHPRVRAFWWPRFERFAAWFAEHEPALRATGTTVHAETTGRMALPAPHDVFYLKARADRLDESAHGVILYDYKTGAPPSKGRVERGHAPQLPLEAAIVASGGFSALASRTVAGLKYISVKGGEPPGDVTDVTPEALAQNIVQQQQALLALIARYDDPATPYIALRRPGAGFENAYRYGRFDQLARVKEWLGDDGEEG